MRPVADITSADILDLVRKVERAAGAKRPYKLRGVISSVFRLAIVTLRAGIDPTAGLRGAALLEPIVQVASQTLGAR